jgi:hypothetical protein
MSHPDNEKSTRPTVYSFRRIHREIKKAAEAAFVRMSRHFIA